MDRRFFLKSLLAGSAVASPVLPALASGLPDSADAAAPALLVIQSDASAALGLGAALAAALHQTGQRRIARRELTGRALREPAHIDAALADGRQGLIVGVMDDASALLFQEIAARHGQGACLQTQHRFTAGDVRHHCRVTGLNEAIVWRETQEKQGTPGNSLAQLYADILNGQPPRSFGSGRPATAQGGAYASLVSFVIKA